MKAFVKFSLTVLSLILMSPFALVSWIEKQVLSGSETIFGICTNIVAVFPGIPGAFLRRAFYIMTLDKCSFHCHIGFGTIISHRSTIIRDHVYIGSYALIGDSDLGEHSLIGSRASILSGEALHELDENGKWTPYSSDMLAKVHVSKNVWIGEGAIVSADIGESCMVGSGAVVSSAIKPYIMVAGNPARFVKKMETKASE